MQNGNITSVMQNGDCNGFSHHPISKICCIGGGHVGGKLIKI